MFSIPVPPFILAHFQEPLALISPYPEPQACSSPQVLSLINLGYFSTCSLTFSPNTVYNSISTMNVALVPTNNLTVSSSIQISFPRSYWTNDISTQLLPINSSMSCIGLTSVTTF